MTQYARLLNYGCPLAINVIDAMQLNESYLDTEIGAGYSYYYHYGWDRDSDQSIPWGRYSTKVEFIADLEYEYWISASPTSIQWGGTDDDFALYINDVRTGVRKSWWGARSEVYCFNITPFLEEGESSVQMYYKDWFGSAWSYSPTYLLQIESVGDTLCSMKLNDLHVIDTPPLTEYVSSTVNVPIIGDEVGVYISGSPHNVIPLNGMQKTNYTTPEGRIKCDVFVGEVIDDNRVVIDADLPSYFNILEYLEEEINEVTIKFKRGSGDLDLVYVSQAYVVRVNE